MFIQLLLSGSAAGFSFKNSAWEIIKRFKLSQNGYQRDTVRVVFEDVVVAIVEAFLKVENANIKKVFLAM